MIALLLKDWRVNRTPVVASVVAMLVPYVIAIIAHFSSRQALAEQMRTVLAAAAGADLVLIAVMAGAFGGNAFAQERLDRSAEFLAMLPVRRSQIIISKLIVSLGCLSLMWIANVAVIVYVTVAGTLNQRIWDTIPVMLFFSFPMFAIAWMFSTFLRSAAISAAVGIFTTFGVFALIASILSLSHFHDTGDSLLTALVYSTNGVLTVVSFVAGTTYYLRRIEP